MSSLFGNQPAGGSLFGSNTTTTNTGNANTAGSLFSRMAPAQNTTNAPSGGSLFGNTTGTTGGLFGNSTNQNTQQNTTGGGLFGGNTNTQNTGTSNLFNTATNQPNTSTSLFGAQNQQSNTNNTSSLFGGLNSNITNNQSSILQPSALNQQSGAASTFSGFNPLSQSTRFPSGLTAAQQREFAATQLTQAGLPPTTNEKNILEQTQTLLKKWDPNSQTTLMQAYLYNAVSTAYAPFFHKQPDEDEASWEKALAEAPKLSEETGKQFVPVLVRGFYDLGKRVEYQDTFIKAMQLRLHEMNNSLTAVMSAHQQKLTTHLETSRRRHKELSQRCLRLAVKCQVLRNRGYALDAAEENLRRELIVLEKSVSDPAFSGREEEIWARMVALRERARWLEEEGKRLGDRVEAEKREGLPEEVVTKTRKIMRDYEGQLGHLQRDLEEVSREWRDWEEARGGRGAR
ncbi:hypothetical protein EJ03DRAFT_326142 [Teratosphaeria nubilosa]|uniref:Nucleoporin Nup54 alpha-helical domain-containing protein n=1 Tax=Teratosphaeria nubilosa TaxID=161662 RepID=A0A6G1LF65_9PEZI|nr:hypothetical protein EJ03DRAFT_326142 [Teratosphaeria nubilosa]